MIHSAADEVLEHLWYAVEEQRAVSCVDDLHLGVDGTGLARRSFARSLGGLGGRCFPVRGAGAFGGRWVVEVEVPRPSLAAQSGDPLPSWNDGATKKSITDFVARVTTPGGADFVPVAERIAVFDNDGTLWAEQPMYFQLAFAIYRVKRMAPQHPEWKDKVATPAFQEYYSGAIGLDELRRRLVKDGNLVLKRYQR